MKLALHLSNPHECGYFQNRPASTLFIDPAQQVNVRTYNALLSQGFRRSGQLIYKPYCKNCNACIPIRVNCSGFQPSRSQKRILSRNADISYQLLKPHYLEEHYKLYKKYLDDRHKKGGMEKHTKLDYHESMINSCVKSSLIEFRLDKKLVCVAVTDVLHNSLSAVYTFFDPEMSKRRSLGTYAILSQIKLAQSMSCKWLYLGYWIEESQKMAYKSNFSASQILTDGEWKNL